MKKNTMDHVTQTQPTEISGNGLTVKPANGPARPFKITVIDYDAKHLVERPVEDIKECRLMSDAPTVTWINVEGVRKNQVAVEEFGACFDLHPLVLEDICSDQRPKVEDYDSYLFIALKMLFRDEKASVIHSEQVSIVLGQGYVLSFQWGRPGDVFDAVRARIRNEKDRARKMGADYLAYLLIDAVVDSCFSILESFGEQVERLEEKMVANPSTQLLQKVRMAKRSILALRRAVWPLREVVAGLDRSGNTLIKKTTRVYLRDVYDHTIQVIETVETFRDMMSGMVDIYLSSNTNKMNEIMKVLTIIATVFIPLTFVTGIYGMNFDHMPELAAPWGYPAALGIMALAAGAMLAYFRKKNWL